MLLVPRCEFALELPEPLVAGALVHATLVVTVDQTLRRAERVRITFESVSSARLGAEGAREHAKGWEQSLEFPIAAEGLVAGTHRYRFELQVPAQLGPAFRTAQCSQEYEAKAELDVDWAVDPKRSFLVHVRAPPRNVKARPVHYRSGGNLSSDVVVQLAIDSDMLRVGDAVRGEIVVRARPGRQHDFVTLHLRNRFMIRMGAGATVFAPLETLRIPWSALVGGVPMPFVIPVPPGARHSVRDGLIDREIELVCGLDYREEEDGVLLTLLPAGSTIEGTEHARPLEPLRAQRSVDEQIGPIRMQLTEEPREGSLGALIALTYPDLALGTSFGELGLLGGFNSSPLLSAALGNRFFLRSKRGTVPDSQRAAFYDAALQLLASARELQLDDHGLRAHLSISQDSDFDAIVLQTRARARRIAGAVAAFPFALALRAEEDEWRTVSSTPGAFLLPHRPAIAGLVVALRTNLGEPRLFPYGIAADDGTLVVSLDLDADLAAFDARRQLGTTPTLATLRTQFELAWDRQRIVARTRSRDLRQAVDAAQQLAAWVIDARGEALVTSPYR